MTGTTAPPPAASPPPAPPSPPLGLSAAGLAAVVAAAGGRAALAGVTTGALKFAHVLPATADDGARYVDVLSARPDGAALVGEATQVLAHAPEDAFLDAVDAAAAWEARHPRAGGGAHFFYIDLLVEDQRAAGAQPFEARRAELGRVVRGVGSVLFLLDLETRAVLGRAWSMLEAAAALACRARFEIVAAPRSEAALVKALVDDGASLERIICAVDVETATAREAADEADIKRAIQEGAGGFLTMNQLVIGAMLEWMVDAGSAALRAIPMEERAVSALQDALAGLLRHQGKLDEAEPLYRDAVAERRKALGDAHPDTLSSVNNLAIVLRLQGKLNKAEPLCRDALAGRRKALGDAHPDTLSSLNHLAGLLRDQGKLDEAEPLCRDALAGRRKALGDAHPDTLSSVNNLAGLLRDQGKLDEAEPLYRDSLAGRRKALGDAHPDTLSSVSNLAMLLKDLAKLDEADALYTELIASKRASLGSAHPSTLDTLEDVAILRAAQGADAEAEALYREALAGLRAALGVAHATPRAVARRLASLLKERGRVAR